MGGRQTLNLGCKYNMLAQTVIDELRSIGEGLKVSCSEVEAALSPECEDGIKKK